MTSISAAAGRVPAWKATLASKFMSSSRLASSAAAPAHDLAEHTPGLSLRREGREGSSRMQSLWLRVALLAGRPHSSAHLSVSASRSGARSHDQ